MDRIVIQPIDPNETSDSGLIIPDTGKEKAVPGKVIAVGPGYDGPTGFIPTTSKVGDTVIYPKFGCHSMTVNGEEYLIIREAELFAKI